MSEIKGNSGFFDPKSKEVGAYVPFPYNVYTDYGLQTMTIVIPGEWTGDVGESPITMTVTYDPIADNSTIVFGFKLAPPNTEIGATLTDLSSDPAVTYGLTLSVPG